MLVVQAPSGRLGRPRVHDQRPVGSQGVAPADSTRPSSTPMNAECSRKRYVVQDSEVAARAFIPDAPVSNRQGYHPELLIHACIGKERATFE